MIYLILYNSPKTIGGVEQVVKNILDNFSDITKKKITLVCNDQNENDIFLHGKIKCYNLKSDRGNMLLNSLFLYSRLIYSYRIYQFLKKNVEDGDTINIHGLEYLFFTSLFQKRIKKNIKIILSVHGSFYQYYTNLSHSFLKRKYSLYLFFFIERYYIYLIEKIANKCADYYIFLTRKTKDFYKDFYKIKRPYSIVPNGMDIKKRYLGKKVIGKNFKIIIIGSNVIAKGLDIAIEAVKKINIAFSPKITELYIIGFPDFYNYYKKNELPHYIYYVGHVRSENMDSWYNKCNCLMLPSGSEEFPLVVLEALCKGLPIIVSNVCNSHEIPDHDKFGYIVDSYNISDWMKAIIDMKNIENYEIFTKNIREYDFSIYEWKIIARKYERIYSIYSDMKSSEL